MQLPSLEHVTVVEGEVLQEPGAQPSWIYFPHTAQISLQMQDPGGQCTELVLIGNTGAAGLLKLGTSNGTPHRYVVVYSGTTWRMPSDVLWQLAESDMLLWRSLMLCNQHTTSLIARTALCNTRHSVAQSLCRSLLLMHDHVPVVPLVLPMRSVRQMCAAPPRVLEKSMAELVHAHAIAVHEEHITVIDRQALMRCCCDCYAVIQQSNQTLFTALLNS